MKFGDNLKKIRKSKMMSQEQLSEKIGVSRQSVSKWENGEAYPEMNNILELCKILNCQINDLVHSDMSDIDLLDKKIIMKAVKFDEQKQVKVKNLCNIIALIGQIGAIVLKVAIPFIVLVMMVLPYVVSNVELSGDEIRFKNENIKLVGGNKIEVHNVVIGEFDDDINFTEIVEIFNSNSRLVIIGYLEMALLFLVINIVIMILVFTNVEKLFNNIKNNHTPFTIDNVYFIKKISYLMIALILVMPMSNALFRTLLDISLASDSFGLISVLEILILYSMSYVFEYGVEIQKDSNGKMYNSKP
ncbi:MAG: helix-turn-helix domain-containing protein [Firmicutes bacterium]|nr:helix-turn-helix domain-containing protein [Bacillota bacterium]